MLKDLHFQILLRLLSLMFLINQQYFLLRFNSTVTTTVYTLKHNLCSNHKTVDHRLLDTKFNLMMA